MQETQETRVWSLGWEDTLEQEIATHSSILAWKIPWTEEEESGRLAMNRTWLSYWACEHWGVGNAIRMLQGAEPQISTEILFKSITEYYK